MQYKNANVILKLWPSKQQSIYCIAAQIWQFIVKKFRIHREIPGPMRYFGEMKKPCISKMSNLESSSQVSYLL